MTSHSVKTTVVKRLGHTSFNDVPTSICIMGKTAYQKRNEQVKRQLSSSVYLQQHHLWLLLR